MNLRRWSDAETAPVSPDLTGLRRVGQLKRIRRHVYAANADKSSLWGASWTFKQSRWHAWGQFHIWVWKGTLIAADASSQAAFDWLESRTRSGGGFKNRRLSKVEPSEMLFIALRHCAALIWCLTGGEDGALLSSREEPVLD